MRDQTRAPRSYELMTIVHPEVSEDDLPGALDRISGFVAGAGGTVSETLRDSPWGRRRLAYPIRNGGRDLRDGYFTVYHFEIEPDRIDDIERELKLDDQVIRYLVTQWAPKPLTPRELEQAEIDAEDAAAAAYAAVQAAAAREAEAAPAVVAEAPAAATAAAEAPAAEAETAEAPAAEAEAAEAPAAEAPAAEAAEAPVAEATEENAATVAEGAEEAATTAPAEEEAAAEAEAEE
ncbi:MAG TPA: 30S ribosomal protein S6, partial [Thermomicrobiales bacterium]|nr:30S ribosomal protein S6 [Thermomicrobiales bacterium]